MKKNRKIITTVVASMLALGATAVAVQQSDSDEGRMEARMEIGAMHDLRERADHEDSMEHGGSVAGHGVTRAFEALAQDDALDKATVDALKDALDEMHKAHEGVITPGEGHHGRESGREEAAREEAAREKVIFGLVADGVLSRAQAESVLEALGNHGDPGHAMGSAMARGLQSGAFGRPHR